MYGFKLKTMSSKIHKGVIGHGSFIRASDGTNICCGMFPDLRGDETRFHSILLFALVLVSLND